MSDIRFLDTDAGKISDSILILLENSVKEPLYPGDERRIFGEALALLFVTFFNQVNDRCRQKMLRYARGEVLDCLGENRGVYRIEASPAVCTMKFSIEEPITTNIIIPKGTEVTADYSKYFETDTTVVLYAGQTEVTVSATSTEGGDSFNNIGKGKINKIVRPQDIPLIDSCTNLDITHSGGDSEEDDAFRLRIRDGSNRHSTAGAESSYRHWAMSANVLISDVSIISEGITIEDDFTPINGHVFFGGADLVPESLEVDGVPWGDYTYHDCLLDVHVGTNTEESAEEEPAADPQEAPAEESSVGPGEQEPSAAEGDSEEGGEAAEPEEPATVHIKLKRTMAGFVKIVPICYGGTIPNEDVLEDVRRVCSADDVRPMTDYVEVEAPKIEQYDIELTYYCKKGTETEVIQTVEGAGGSIAQYNIWQQSTFMPSINPDKLKQLILCPHDSEGNVITGAYRVEITKPTFTELGGTTIAQWSGKADIKHVVGRG